MGRQEEIAKEIEKINKELEIEDVNSGMHSLCKRLSNSKFFSDDRSNLTVEDEALIVALESLDEKSRVNLYERAILYKTRHLLDLGSTAQKEDDRVRKTLAGKKNNAPKYGLDFGDAKYNIQFVDHAVMYSTKMLNEKRIKELDVLNMFIADKKYFGDKMASEHDVTVSILSDPMLIKSRNTFKTDVDHYNIGNKVYSVKPLKEAEIIIDPEDNNKVKFSKIDPKFIEDTVNAHTFIEGKRKLEQDKVRSLKSEILNDCGKDGNKLKKDEDIDSLAVLFAYMGSDINDYKTYSLREHNIKNEAEYLEKRHTYLADESERLMKNPVFRDFARNIENVNGLFKKSNLDIYDEWYDYKNNVNADIKRMKSDPENVIQFSVVRKLTADTAVEECKREAHSCEVVCMKSSFLDIELVSKYFVCRMMSEPGAKRTFFGKGIDYNDKDKADLRTPVRPDKNGEYSAKDINLAAYSIRETLLKDEWFLNRVALGEPLDVMYNAYKAHNRARSEEIAKLETLEIRKASSKTKEIASLTNDEFKYLKKTRDELDSLYSAGGMFRSKYMKKLYNALTEVINEAEESNLEGNGLKVKSDKLFDLHNKGVTYYKERKAKYLDAPVTDRGKARLQIVENLISHTDKAVERIEKGFDMEKKQADLNAMVR